jgi:hypothetical protein
MCNASGACRSNGIVLQFHHVFEIAREKEQRLGILEGRC